MNTQSKFAFLILILAQAMHSVEEYLFRLYEVFPPAQFVSRLVSNNLSVGFAIFNIALVLFGIWCYLSRVRANHKSASTFAWLWILIEGVNGIGHLLLGLLRGGYFPGLITAPLLFVISVYLAFKMLHSQTRIADE